MKASALKPSCFNSYTNWSWSNGSATRTRGSGRRRDRLVRPRVTLIFSIVSYITFRRSTLRQGEPESTQTPSDRAYRGCAAKTRLAVVVKVPTTTRLRRSLFCRALCLDECVSDSLHSVRKRRTEAGSNVISVCGGIVARQDNALRDSSPVVRHGVEHPLK